MALRALITGASGFCGSHLLPYLASQGVETWTLGTRSAAPRHFTLSHPADLASLVAVMQTVQPDFVFHLAGLVHSPNVAEFYQVNCVYAATLLQALEQIGLRCPVLLVGTAAEYGLIQPDQLPIREDLSAQPYSHYGISKLAQTQMGLTLARQGCPLVMVRPFNILGPGMPSYLALASFARQLAAILRGEQAPTLRVGNLDSARDFVDVRTVVQIYWELIRQPAAQGQVINLCSGKATRLADLLQQLIQQLGVEVRIEVATDRYKAIDIPVHYGSGDKLQQLLGYAPRFDLDAALTAMAKETAALLP